MTDEGNPAAHVSARPNRRWIRSSSLHGVESTSAINFSLSLSRQRLRRLFVVADRGPVSVTAGLLQQLAVGQRRRRRRLVPVRSIRTVESRPTVRTRSPLSSSRASAQRVFYDQNHGRIAARPRPRLRRRHRRRRRRRRRCGRLVATARGQSTFRETFAWNRRMRAERPHQRRNEFSIRAVSLEVVGIMRTRRDIYEIIIIRLDESTHAHTRTRWHRIDMMTFATGPPCAADTKNRIIGS